MSKKAIFGYNARVTLFEFILAWRALAPVVKGKCFYCGRQTSKEGKSSRALYQTRDHVVPRSTKGYLGESYPARNRVICCRKCNAMKDDLTLEEFKRRSGMATFYAEEILGMPVDDLSDIAEVTLFILSSRKIEGRSIKFHGKLEPRTGPPGSTPESSSPQV